MSQLKKSACVQDLIYRIQSLLPETCAICEESYTIKKDDPPFMSCSICKQEVHRECYSSLFTASNILNIPGLHYLCPSCEADLIPDEKSGLKKSVKISTDDAEDTRETSVEKSASTRSDKLAQLSDNPPHNIQSISHT